MCAKGLSSILKKARGVEYGRKYNNGPESIYPKPDERC